MKVLHLGDRKRNERQTPEAHRHTQGEQQRRCHHFTREKGRIFLFFKKSIWLENSPLLKTRVKCLDYTEFLGEVKNHLKYTTLRKNITFIREADTRVQLRGATQIFLGG